MYSESIGEFLAKINNSAHCHVPPKLFPDSHYLAESSDLRLIAKTIYLAILYHVELHDFGT